MKTKSEKRRCFLLAALCAVSVVAVTSCRQAASAEELADRASRHYTAAMAELQAGHVDAAIKGFESVIKAEPGNGKSNKAGTNNLGSNIGASTRYLYDASFLRIRNLAFGYTLPKRICQKVGMEGIRFSANFQNLWTFDKYPGYTVEANYRGNSSTNNGVDFGGYPLSRVMTFGVNINF